MASAPIYAYAFEFVENAVNVATSGIAGQTIAMCSGVVIGMVTIYYMIMGYMMVAGTAQSPFADFVKLLTEKDDTST